MGKRGGEKDLNTKLRDYRIFSHKGLGICVKPTINLFENMNFMHTFLSYIFTKIHNAINMLGQSEIKAISCPL